MQQVQVFGPRLPYHIASKYAAPSLALENVFDVVKDVQSWRTLGQHIL